MTAKFEQVSIFIFHDVYFSSVIAINLFGVVSKMSQQLPLTAEMFYSLALSNPMFNCFVYIIAMATILFIDFTVHFYNLIALEDD